MMWTQALEAQMDTHKCYLSPMGCRYFNGFLAQKYEEGTWRDSSINAMYLEFIETLWRADTMYVSADMHKLVNKAALDYEGGLYVLPQDVLTKRGFVLLEEPIWGEDVHGDKASCSAMAWASSLGHPNFTMLYFLVDTSLHEDMINQKMHKLWDQGAPRYPYEIAHILPLFSPVDPNDPMLEDVNPRSDVRTGLRNPDCTFRYEDFDQQGGWFTLGMLRYWIALNIIARQTVGEVTKMAPPRASRKRARRWDKEGPERYISLITLRHKKAKHNEEPKEVPWSHRWVVSGFWRRQWYPSDKVHRWKYIHEYVKGPEDKPLIIRERRVFNLVR